MGHGNCDRCGHDTKMCECPEGVNDHQVGGDHYRSAYQHWDWSIDMAIGPIEYAATKYISRWWKKHGHQDIEKAKHYVQKIRDAHLEGRYPTGLSRLSSVGFSAFRTMKFGQANNLSEQESMFCWMMAGWETVEALDAALAILDGILQSPQMAAEGRKGAGVG